jgi:transketolase
VLPKAVKRRIGVEAGVEQGWQKYLGDGGKFVGVTTFGASAPYERLQKEYGLTPEHVLEVAKSLF